MAAALPAPILRQALERFSRKELALHLNRAPKTIARWEKGETPFPSIVEPALRELLQAGKPTANDNSAFTFSDLFAGIGGIRQGFESLGGRCVFTSEWNEWSKKTYCENYRDGHEINGDITKIDARHIPDHDILLAGFPCQPFSIAGVSKKNALGRPHGFECTTQGTLFFDVQRILEEKRPRAFLLENVKNLVSHDKGNTFKVIRDVLSTYLNYHVECRVIDAKPWVPQHRERIIIVGFKDKTDFSFDDLLVPKKHPDIASILHPEDGSEEADGRYTFGKDAKVHSKYTLSDKLWRFLQGYAAKHQAAGNGFGFGLVRAGVTQASRTLSARYYKDGSEILVWQNGKNPRRLTPRECARLMGYPDTFAIPVSDTQAYKQFGNSVVVPVIEAVAKAMVPRVVQSKQQDAAGARQEPLFVPTPAARRQRSR